MKSNLLIVGLCVVGGFFASASWAVAVLGIWFSNKFSNERTSR